MNPKKELHTNTFYTQIPNSMRDKLKVQIDARVVEQFEDGEEMLLVKGGSGFEASVQKLNIINCSCTINKKKCTQQPEEPIEVAEQ